MKEYNVAYITQPSGYNFAPILEQCTSVKFLTTGYEEEKDLVQVVKNALSEYDPEQDVLVPVGGVVTNLIIGIVADRIRRTLGKYSIHIAVYCDKTYTIQQIDSFERDGHNG